MPPALSAIRYQLAFNSAAGVRRKQKTQPAPIASWAHGYMKFEDGAPTEEAVDIERVKKEAPWTMKGHGISASGSTSSAPEPLFNKLNDLALSVKNGVFERD